MTIAPAKRLTDTDIIRSRGPLVNRHRCYATDSGLAVLELFSRDGSCIAVYERDIEEADAFAADWDSAATSAHHAARRPMHARRG